MPDVPGTTSVRLSALTTAPAGQPCDGSPTWNVRPWDGETAEITVTTPIAGLDAYRVAPSGLMASDQASDELSPAANPLPVSGRSMHSAKAPSMWSAWMKAPLFGRA